MKPGRELDALLAEKVMGIDLAPVEHFYGLPTYSVKPVSINSAGSWTETPEPEPYSTDIAAAWLVVEKLKDTHYDFEISNDPGELYQWIAYFGQHGTSEETAPHAICLAALKAMGVEVKSD